MAKLNLVKTLNEVRDESFNPHPYWGLKCNRGLWLTRFPIENMPEDPAFMMEFIRSGGNLDAMGHYGSAPEQVKKFYLEGWSLDEIRLFAKGVPSQFCRVTGVTENNWKVYEKGLARAKALDLMGVDFKCSLWTLSNKSIKTFLRILFSKGFRVTSHIANYSERFVINGYVNYRQKHIHSTRSGEEYEVKEALVIEGLVNYKLEDILPPAFLAYCRKCVLTPKRQEWPSQPQKSFIFSSLRAARIFSEKSSFSDSFFSVGGRLKLGEPSVFGYTTSKGVVFHIYKDILVNIKLNNERKEISRSEHSIRQVAGFNVCKIEETWFVWAGNFANHIEGTGSLKSVLELAEKRRKKDSLILTLNDVRNDRSGTAGYCLAGTKGFLQARMPHVYNLIKDYNSWSEIPEEIMAIEWPLVSKRIFDGYRSPVN